MQREDVDRLAHYAAMLGIPLGDEHAALRDHHETVAATLRALLAERDALQGQLNDLRNGWANSVKAHAALLAERDAAFAAGQEEMRERAGEAVWGVSDAGYTTHSDMEDAIRALPIKDGPDGR